jgi:hypothetical protein
VQEGVVGRVADVGTTITEDRAGVSEPGAFDRPLRVSFLTGERVTDVVAVKPAGNCRRRE